jgi:hypothetical protein
MPRIFFVSSPAKRVFTFIMLFWFLFGLASCGFVLYLLYFHLGSRPFPWYLVVVVSSIVQFFVYVAGAALIFLIAYGISRVIGSRRARVAPDALFVDRILAALEIVARTDGSWTHLGSKSELMRALEDAARIAGENLPRALRTADPYTDAWLRSRCDEIAASLRAKKTWVCMPKSDTREQLEQSLTNWFVDAASGNWDYLETAERPHPSRKIAKFSVYNFFLGVFVASLPAAVYRGAQTIELLTPGLLSNYLGFGVVLWAIIAILVGVDPRLGEKVEAVRKLASVVPGLSKKSEE